jgi:hypothetical protein
VKPFTILYEWQIGHDSKHTQQSTLVVWASSEASAINIGQSEIHKMAKAIQKSASIKCVQVLEGVSA